MTKLPSEFTIQDDFPAVGYDEWRAVVEDALKGAPFERKLVTHTYEGIDVQPIYSRQDRSSEDAAIGFPGFAPFIRGSQPLGKVMQGWDLRQEHTHPDLAEANRAILDDLEGGATSVLLKLDSAAQTGIDVGDDTANQLMGHEGLMVYSVNDLDRALANVQLDLIGIALDAGAAFAPAAAMLVSLWRRSDVTPNDARGAFNADPLAALARSGQLPISPSDALDSLAELATWTSHNLPHVTSIGIDTSPYHDAGATAVQDIAFSVATAVEYLRAIGDQLNIEAAANQILFRMTLGTHHFLAIAKLRAARRVWSRIIEACWWLLAIGRHAASRSHQQSGANSPRSIRQSLKEYGGGLCGGHRWGRYNNLPTLRHLDWTGRCIQPAGCP